MLGSVDEKAQVRVLMKNSAFVVRKLAQSDSLQVHKLA